MYPLKLDYFVIVIFFFFIEVAFSANDNHVLIYKKSGGKWTHDAVLSEVCINVFILSNK